MTNDFGYVSLDILYVYAEDSGEYVARAVNELGEDITRSTIIVAAKDSVITTTQLPKGMEKGVERLDEIERDLATKYLDFSSFIQNFTNSSMELWKKKKKRIKKKKKKKKKKRRRRKKRRKRRKKTNQEFVNFQGTDSVWFTEWQETASKAGIHRQTTPDRGEGGGTGQVWVQSGGLPEAQSLVDAQWTARDFRKPFFWQKNQFSF